MTDTNTGKISLRKEAWSEIKATKHVWEKLAIGFVLILTVLQAFFVGKMNFLVAMKLLGDKAPEQQMNMVAPQMGGLVLISILMLIGLLAFFYAISTLYVGYASKIPNVRLDIGEFFFWLKKVAFVFLILTGGGFAFAMVFGISTFVFNKIGAPFLSVPIFIAGLVALIHVSIRYKVVTPLAVLHREPVLKTSWDLTRGQTWRIFSGLVVMMFQLVLAMLIPLIFVAILETAFSNSSLTLWLSAFVYAGYQIASIIISAIYSCVTYRVLLQESKG